MRKYIIYIIAIVIPKGEMLLDQNMLNYQKKKLELSLTFARIRNFSVLLSKM